jgi:hypothetical protein
MTNYLKFGQRPINLIRTSKFTFLFYFEQYFFKAWIFHTKDKVNDEMIRLCIGNYKTVIHKFNRVCPYSFFSS